MPIKKDGMLFEMHPSPAKSDDGKTLYYPRPLKGKKLTIKQVDGLCKEHHRTYGYKLESAFEAFMEEVGYWLSEGYRIDTPIGSFAPKLGLKRQITDPDDVKGNDVRFEGVEYNPGKLWQKEVGKWLKGFRPMGNANTAEVLSDSDRLRQILDRYVGKGGMVTVRQFALASGLTYYSARQRLDAWTEGEQPVLLRSRVGKTFIYTAL